MSSINPSIEADDAYFKGLIDLIPPHFYFDKETRDDLAELRSSQLDGKFKNLGKHKGRAELSGKAKIKRLKYDPEQQKTVSQIKEMMAEVQKTKMESGESESEVEEEPSANVKERKKKNRPSKKSGKTVESGNDLPTKEALLEKLHVKIAALQGKRLTANEEVEKKRLRRKESKLKLKIRRQKENKKNKTQKSTAGMNGHVIGTPSGSTPKPIYNKEGKMVFSKFDFTDSAEKDKHSNALTGKDYKKLLEKVEKRKQKMQELKGTDPDKGKMFQEKVAWETAVHKAEGVKVKDNPEYLKRALKKKEKMKVQRTKKWEERQERTEKQMHDKQMKRKKNITAKKNARIEQKIKKQKKKGRVIPGF